MTASFEYAADAGVLLVYYSRDARRELEAALGNMRLEAYPVDGRAPDATAQLKRHPAGVIVIDHAARDVSVAQAVRRVGQLLPTSLVITASSACEPVELYRAGHLIGEEDSLEEALRKHAEYVGQNPRS